jgi:hypothetical protein
MFACRRVWGHRPTGCISGTVPGKPGRIGILFIVENIRLSHRIGSNGIRNVRLKYLFLPTRLIFNEIRENELS